MLIIFTCDYFQQALQGIQGFLAAMEKWGLLDHLVPLVTQVAQGKPVQVRIHWLLCASFPIFSSTPAVVNSS